MTREAINRIKIEQWRVSQIPVDSAETIYQGDLMVWDVANRRATKGTAASAGTFCGMSDTTNPVASASATLADTASKRINLVQQGLVEVILGESVTLYPFDMVTIGADAQTVLKTGADANNMVGYVDPKVGAAGKAVVSGSLINIWLKVPAAYKVS